jgi:DNA-binding transcriptional regulator YiaG
MSMTKKRKGKRKKYKLIVPVNGRPTKYKDQRTVNKVEKYLRDESIPTISGLAIYLDITSETVRAWVKKHKEFSLSVKKVLDRQQEILIQRGLTGGKDFNSTMAIFLLKANHGMIETSRREIVGEVTIRPILGGTTKIIEGEESK